MSSRKEAMVASNYETICKQNRESYGTKGALKSGQLAAGLYDDRTHFIFELLQNAEDALGRRGEWNGSRKVAFILSPTCLMLSHFGKPFDEADVRSICDIAESTKNESSIGRFGLGFKSVYTITDLPEIHSGDEDFAIEDYVFPKVVPRVVRTADETKIILPLRPEDVRATQDITAGFRHLGPGALLFLRHIHEISWSVEGGASGFYIRNAPENLGPAVQRIKLIGKEDDRPEVDQNWLVFHRDVFSTEGNKVGRTEIAFLLVAAKDAPDRWVVHPLAKSPLVVFFPTVVESHLGFLVQGPYRTTPSRDNIPPGDPWNQHLVEETSILLLEALRWMRDKAMLDISVLNCLPLGREKFPEGSRFSPMFDAVLQAFRGEELLLTFDEKYVRAHQAKLARTQELRHLFSPEQISALFGPEVVAWLSGEITQDKAPEIRQYTMYELDIDEITPIKLMPSLTKSFLEAQSDDWVLRLYEFLSGQEKALGRHLDTVPLIRLEDGTHVVARVNGKAKAFLPSHIATSFPTIRRAVCARPEVRSFLASLGIAEPDLVDDVIWNILPKYKQDEVGVDEASYAADIERICAAYNTDSTSQKEKLKSALQDASFVMVVDTGDGKGYIAKPGSVYMATDRLQQLFSGVPGIFIVDNNYDCLRGEGIRDLLAWCGASRYLVQQETPSELGPSELARIRREAGLLRASRHSSPEDFTLRGLNQLLEFLPSLNSAEAAARAKVLWEALIDLEMRGPNVFLGTYRWSYAHESRTARFDAEFVRTLNRACWVPNANGELVPPGLVVFENLGWKSNQFLLAKITFKPPIIDQLAKEVGINPAILDLLLRNPSIVAELESRLSASSAAESEPSSGIETEGNGPAGADVYDSASDLYGDDMPSIPPGSHDPDGGDAGSTSIGVGLQGRSGSGMSAGGGQGNRGNHGRSSGHGTPGSGGGGNARGRQFISYVGVHPDEDNVDPDGLSHADRMSIEGRAIDLIVALEPFLRRSPEGNPGFDLFEVDGAGRQIRWVEVKAMTGPLRDRAVGMSHTQFECARQKGDAYWLYIVEYATDSVRARVFRIQNPAGRASTYTFDHGWSDIAQVDSLE